MITLTSSSPSWCSCSYTCSPILQWRAMRISHVHTSSLHSMPCSTTPGTLNNPAITGYPILLSTNATVSAVPNAQFRGSITSANAYGLLLSLSTLNPCCYLHKLKTRSRHVGTFTGEGLTPSTRYTPRGAPQNCAQWI